MVNARSSLVVVDDDPITCNRLKTYFEGEGYQVAVANNGDEMWRVLKAIPSDIVLLDIGLPGKDGLELARELCIRHEHIGVILVTGRNDDIDKIVGLESGADDYVTKPFHTRELLARVKILLRRCRRESREQAVDNYSFSGWKIDFVRRRLFDREGGRVFLTDGEFDLLSVMARHPGTVLSRERLMQTISHRAWDPNDRTIDVLIRRLRRKIEADPGDPQFITTVRGEGYVFTALSDS